MHILSSTTATLDDLVEPVDLGQEPADMIFLSFTDSDLSAVTAAWDETLPTLRAAPLRELRHPMSVDLWIDRVAAHAKTILVRILGGYDWWRYGCDRLSELARRKGIALALLPGECREEDARLGALSTLPPDELRAIAACFREGGAANMRVLLNRLARHAGRDGPVEEATPLPRVGFYDPARGAVDAYDNAHDGRPVVPILFYRSMLLAGDVAPIDALCSALRARGIEPAPIYLSSLKDGDVARFVEEAARELSAAAILTTTAFAVGGSLFERLGVPVLQAVMASTRREAWEGGQRGLTPADLAMHVVLPELDGRILAGAISFKDKADPDARMGFTGQLNSPRLDRVAAVADRLHRLLALQRKPRGERRIAILMPDYPGAAGRTGYAVGLDVPQSVLDMLILLKREGYDVDDIPETPRALLDRLERRGEGMDVESWRVAFDTLPEMAQAQVIAAWGEPAVTAAPPSVLPDISPSRGEIGQSPKLLISPLEGEMSGRTEGGGTVQPAHGRSIPFRAARFGNVTVALAPDRGRSEDRRADYHDPALPPRHELLAFGVWLRASADAIIHVGAHGTLEWLPGKTVALSQDCFPEIVTGGLPVIYPFIVSNPGEAAQAKRRISAVTIGHLPPPLTGAGLSEAQQYLERLVDEYAQADGMDRRRRDRLARLIVDKARDTRLASEAGVSDNDDPDAALMRIDAWLCDLKDFAIKDGLHVFGRAGPDEADKLRIQSAAAERDALLAALDARHVAPGPSGAPARGRLDVLPTGRNLFASDPRTMPTPTALEIGTAAADEVLRRYLQDHGDWPRSLVIDLWGSASLRTGGEEIAQGLSLMGCRPQWDPATGRVTAIEVLPPAAIGRPRVDVTWRISGLFRDMFGAQIALIDAAVAAVAARDEAPGDNPLAEAAQSAGKRPSRIFGSSPGTYGAGIESLLASGDWQEREEIGRAYLDATSFAFGGAEGEGAHNPGAFAERVAEADLLVHTGDDPGRDILEGSADVAFIGGFSAALAALGRSADVIALDTTDPKRPRARSVAEAVTRTVRARAVNPRFIEGQMRHGPRGASEFAETVDRLVGFAETTQAIPSHLLDLVHDAYIGDEKVRAFLLEQNPAAAILIAERFMAARRRGLWHPLRNSVDDDLSALIAEARGKGIAA
jgi:cobaltochelatase CobN